MPKIFVDGHSGTTGLRIRERLIKLQESTNTEFTFLQMRDHQRKDIAAKKELLDEADLVILCLPDEAAREVVKVINAMGKSAPRVIDTSTAHRTHPDWVYGFPELRAGKAQAETIKNATKVSNPGCHATGAIALLRPLVDAKIVGHEQALSIFSVTGYTGGGTTMIAAYEQSANPPNFVAYGLNLAHKHLPEIMQWSEINTTPIFLPGVGNFPQGMLISIPLHLPSLLMPSVTAEQIHKTLAEHYIGSSTVHVMPLLPPEQAAPMPAHELQGKDYMELFVFHDSRGEQAVLMARLDNLGKGASGAAVQNLQLMLDIYP